MIRQLTPLGNVTVAIVVLAILAAMLFCVQPWSGCSPSPYSGSASSTVVTAARQDSGTARDSRTQVSNYPTATVAPLTALANPSPTQRSAGPVKVSTAEWPVVNAEQIAVMDEDSGAILYGKNERQRTPMASVTKIATAIVALEKGKIKTQVKVNFDPAKLIDSTAMGIAPGETYTLEDLLYGLMLPSGNDAALAIATHIAGSEAAFVDLLNAKAKELGLVDTKFANPHGLDDPQHYSTAQDMATLARYAMANPEFRKLAMARSWDVTGSKSFTVYNKNRLLTSYDGADGVKIGYTEEAGRTTVASAVRNGHRIYVAFMHGGDTVNDVTPLLDFAFANYRWPSTTMSTVPLSTTPLANPGLNSALGPNSP